MGPFSEFFRDLPDGSFWQTGRFWKRFGALADKDRFRLAETSGSEMPMPSGRFGLIKPGDSASSVDDVIWLVHVRNTATTGAAVWKRGVDIQSPLQQSVDPQDIIFPTGRLDDADPAKAGGYVETDGDDFIWAEIAFDASNVDNPFSIVTFSIKSLSNGDTYNGRGIYANLGSGDSPQYVQTKLCIPVATMENTPGKTPPVPRVKLRYLKTPLRLVARSFTMYDSSGASPRDVGGMDYEA